MSRNFAFPRVGVPHEREKEMWRREEIGQRWNGRQKSGFRVEWRRWVWLWDGKFEGSGMGGTLKQFSFQIATSTNKMMNSEIQ